MKREPKQKPWAGIWDVLAVAAAMSFVMTFCLTAVRRTGEEQAVPAMTSCAAAGEVAQRAVVPMGKAVGIKLFSDGVLVVGLSPVETQSGKSYPGRDCGLKEGDVITHIDGSEVDTIEEIQAAVARREGGPLTIQAVRGQRQLQLTAAPVANEKGVYQLGVWLRDSMAGIGTMTFYDPSTGEFGALGHGINDVDTSMLMPLESGGIMRAQVTDVKKGENGQPGELHGQFDMQKDVGTLYANRKTGIFGTLTDKNLTEDMSTVPVASAKEVKNGEAVILSNIAGDKVEQFTVKITRVSDNSDTRNLMVEVIDPRLLETTGGIVQGMSGSPIIQDGKLVGAVTHVLVNDPTRGYGIFIENMLNAAA